VNRINPLPVNMKFTVAIRMYRIACRRVSTRRAGSCFRQASTVAVSSASWLCITSAMYTVGAILVRRNARRFPSAELRPGSNLTAGHSLQLSRDSPVCSSTNIDQTFDSEFVDSSPRVRNSLPSDSSLVLPVGGNPNTPALSCQLRIIAFHLYLFIMPGQ